MGSVRFLLALSVVLAHDRGASIIDAQIAVQMFYVVSGYLISIVLTEVKNGNFNARMPIDQVGLSGKICDTLNDIIGLNEKMMLEFTKAGNTIGNRAFIYS